METIRWAAPTMNVNKYKIPCNRVSLETYNYYVRYYNELYELGEINRTFIKSQSHGISIAKDAIKHNINCYEVFNTNAMHEIIIVNYDGSTRIQYWHGMHTKLDDDISRISGSNAFKYFTEELAKDGIDIKKYYIDNGREVKESIPKPLIGCTNKLFYDKTFDNCHHLDINQAYPYAMTLMIPEWTQTIQRLYEKRKTSAKYKAILNYSYGYFQAKHWGAKLAHISKFCVQHTIDALMSWTSIIEANNGTVLGYNTDGIWYQGELLNIPDDTQKRLGGVKYDHKNCTLRFKSDGAYEFIENGKYYPVLRGSTNLDTWKPRDLWQWGDIYKAVVKLLTMSETEYGVIKEVEDGEIRY